MDNNNNKNKSHFLLTNVLVILLLVITVGTAMTSYPMAKMMHEGNKLERQEEKIRRQAEKESEKAEKESRKAEEEFQEQAEKESKEAEEEEKSAYEEASKKQADIEEAHNPEGILLSYVKKTTEAQQTNETSVYAEIHFTIKITNNTGATINNVKSKATITDKAGNSLATLDIGSGGDVNGEALSVAPESSKDFEVILSQTMYDGADYSDDLFTYIYNIDDSDIDMDFQLTYVSFTDGYVLS